MPKDLLLEIGVEELPARFIPPALEQLKSIAEEKLTQTGLAFQKISVFGTPRRIAFLATGVPEKSPDQLETATGPLAKDARDASGGWSLAALGFAKSLGVLPEQLKVVPTPRGERLGLEKVNKGELASKLLQRLIPEIVSALRFPKTMVWEESRFAFARPIRWLLALYGTRVIKFHMAGVRSGSHSYGLLDTSPKKINVPSPQRYLSLLKNRCVIADPAERAKTLRQVLEQSARRVKGQILAPPELFTEVVNLVEHPVAVAGSFDSRYLELPVCILRSVLQKHQKFFPVLQPRTKDPEPIIDALHRESKPLNHFVAIRNGVSVNQETVQEGYERVLSARLADAEFFYKQDRKKKLEEFAQGLSGVGFHEKLGSMADKVKRVEYIAKVISDQLQLNTDIQKKIVRAAQIYKADLLTHVVYELPELQGVIGRIYADKDQEHPEVAAAIEEHYWPLTAEGHLPQGPVASVLALADKLDTLCADFSIGIMPTGSADPHGLRKAGTGIIRILLENNWSLPLNQLVEWSCDLIKQGDKNLQEQVLNFLKSRLENWLLSREYKIDEITAVMAVDFRNLPDFLARLNALHDIRKEPDFKNLSVAFKRTANIIHQAEKNGSRIDSLLATATKLQEPAETNLFNQLRSLQPNIVTELGHRNYSNALKLIVGLKSPIDHFFNEILVMHENQDIRLNRLGLLSEIHGLFAGIADFKLLQDAPSTTSAVVKS